MKLRSVPLPSALIGRLQAYTRHFHKGLLEQLGREAKFYRGDAKGQLHRGIELMKGTHHRQPVVAIDETHLLDREMLVEVRFLPDSRIGLESAMAPI